MGPKLNLFEPTVPEHVPFDAYRLWIDIVIDLSDRDFFYPEYPTGDGWS